MALLNTGCLVSTIQADVTGLTTGSPVECFVILAAGLDSAISDRCVTVPTSGSLPSLWPTQTVPQGQVMFVDDVGVPVIAASGKWIGFDQRVFRRDAPIQGELYTWGGDGSLLGQGTTTPRSSPVTVAGGGTTWCNVSSEGTNPFVVSAIKGDGTLWTWGFNTQGQLGDGTTTTRSSPGTTAGGGATWCQISAGGSSAAGIKTDGTLWTWGSNGNGILGDGTTASRCSPGTVAGGGTNWCYVSIGLFHTMAVKTDGTLWTWGWNNQGMLGNGGTTARCSPGTTAGGGTNWSLACAGNEYSAAIKTDGTLWLWGCAQSGYGRLGTGDNTNRSSPVTTAGGGTNWCWVSIASRHSVGVKTDGTLWTWGYNGSGQLGDGTTTNRSSPGTTAGGGTNWTKAAVAFGHSAAIKTDGTLWTWGGNSDGRLGNGTTTSRCSPGTVVGGINTWVIVAAGRESTRGIKI